MRQLESDSDRIRPVRLPHLWRKALGALHVDGPAGQVAAKAGTHAELFFVSADMAALATNAAADLPEVHLGRDLWPTEVGFMVFASPVYVHGFQHTEESQRSTEAIRAILWAPEGEGLSISMFSDVTAAVHMAHQASGAATSVDEVVREVAAYSQRHGHLVPIARGYYPVNVPVRVDDEGQSSHMEPHLAILLSTVWLLMQQPLVVESTETQVDSKTAKRLRKADQPVPTVRLIDLRRTRGESHAGAGSRNYEHQWMVRGHWRKQWLPSLQMHRPTWVRPHLKGPDGAPMLVGEKVNVWRR